MTTLEYDELNTRVSGLENTVYSSPYDPATVKGVFNLDVDSMVSYLESTGRIVGMNGEWSLENILLAISDATGIQIGYGTYVLTVNSGSIVVNGSTLEIGDQLAITTDENYQPVSALINDQTAPALAAERIEELELRIAQQDAEFSLLETRISALETHSVNIPPSTNPTIVMGADVIKRQLSDSRINPQSDGKWSAKDIFDAICVILNIPKQQGNYPFSLSSGYLSLVGHKDQNGNPTDLVSPTQITFIVDGSGNVSI